MARETRRQRRAARAAAADGASTSRRARAAGSAVPTARQAADRSEDREAARAVRPRVVRRAPEGRLADEEPDVPGCRRRDHRVHDRRPLPLGPRPGHPSPRRPRSSLGAADVSLVRHQHLLGTREQGQDESRAPHRLAEPAAGVPPGGRPDRAGHRDEGRPEGADREARASGLRPREHEHVRRGVDRREGDAGVTGFVGAGAKPVPLSQPEVDRILHHGAPTGPARSRSRRSSSRSASP